MGIVEAKSKVIVEIDAFELEWVRRIMEESGEETTGDAIGLALSRYILQMMTLQKGDAYVVIKRNGMPNHNLCKTLHGKLQRLEELEAKERQANNAKNLRLKNWIPAGARAAVYLRDDGKCTRCESTERLDVHHIKPRYQGGGNQVSNLLLLCRPCHAETHKELGDGCDHLLLKGVV